MVIRRMFLVPLNGHPYDLFQKVAVVQPHQRGRLGNHVAVVDGGVGVQLQHVRIVVLVHADLHPAVVVAMQNVVGVQGDFRDQAGQLGIDILGRALFDDLVVDLIRFPLGIEGVDVPKALGHLVEKRSAQGQHA